MNTLDELLYYCNENEPVGALLLSGEWGCGKTYLIEHDLKEQLADKAIILRISLFGMSTPEEIHVAIRNRWMDKYCEIKGIDGIAKKIGSGKEVLGKLDFLPEWLKGIATTDTSIFFPIGKEVDGRNVILIFDDLERCRMSSVDVLGVINDYCENRKFHTIIVANQEKLNTPQGTTSIVGEIQFASAKGDTSVSGLDKAIIRIDAPAKREQGEFSYAEIKEKIIQRTVQYSPNYKEIVHAVITDLKYEDDEYKAFIKSCEEGLLELFASDEDGFEQPSGPDKGNQFNDMEQEIPTFPHNIRSLKCAIKDFYRVYCPLRDNEFKNLENWLYSFTSYVIAYKADQIREDGSEIRFSDDKVHQMYPAFQEEYILNSVKKWVLYGIWHEDMIEYELNIIKQRNEARNASEIIKFSRIMDIDDDTLKEGFSDFLNMAYDGGLSLDEYVLLIENSFWAREYKCILPEPIDWDKIEKGVEQSIKKLKDTLPEEQILFSIIGDDQQSNFTDQEWRVYKRISQFALGDELMFFRNKKIYVDKMSEYGVSAFMFIQNKRYNTFDEEMANITAQTFENETNAGKNQFIIDFKKIWSRNIMSPDIQLENTIRGFEVLKACIEKSISERYPEAKTFSLIHMERFVAVLAELIERCKKELPVDKGV